MRDLFVTVDTLIEHIELNHVQGLRAALEAARAKEDLSCVSDLSYKFFLRRPDYTSKYDHKGLCALFCRVIITF